MACPDCHGLTVKWRGKGKNSEYRICHNWQKPGHLTRLEIEQAITRTQRTINPSGRFA